MPRKSEFKDPERVRLGRLGALVLHASGKTNTRPARAAWEAALASEFGIDDTLTPAEREKRLNHAMRARMARLARSRWAKKKAASVTDDHAGGQEVLDESEHRAAA